jgi:5'-nucleotidase
VRVLAFNDFHGNLRPPTGGIHGVAGPVGGAAYFSAHLRNLGAGRANTVVVAAGDLVGASPLASALFHDEPTVEVMNAMGLDVTSLGNHELDEGIAELLRLKRGGCHPKDGCRFEDNFGGARYDILGANVLEKASGHAPLPPYTIRTFEGISIAFVGMTLEDTPSVVVPSGIEGLKFADETRTASALVPDLKRRGVEAIVLLVHQGGLVKGGGLDDCNELHGPIVKIAEQLDPAIDAIVSGHTHALYNCRVAGRPVTSALSFGRVITALDLTIDRSTHDVIEAEAHNHAVSHNLAPDPNIERIVERAVTLAAPLENRVIGRIAKTIRADAGPSGESPLGSVIADAQLEATRKEGATIAVLNHGGIRSDLVYPRSGVEAEDGLVTYGEAFTAQPFGNLLVTLTLTGAELIAFFEGEMHGTAVVQVSAGTTLRWTTKGPKRVVAVKINGTAVAEGDRVRITVNNFLADTNTVLKRARDRVVGGTDLEALEAYFKAHAVVDAPKVPRIEREP